MPLAIATSRYWPLLGDDALHLQLLAEAWCEAGHDVYVVTPQWHRSWPRLQVLNGVQVHRLPGGPRGAISALRWMYRLRRWFLDQDQPAFRAVVIGGLRYEAYTLLALPQFAGRAVVVPAQGDLTWQQTAAFGQRVAALCRGARLIVAGTNFAREELTAAGYAYDAIQVVPRGYASIVVRNPAAKATARAVLAAVNYDLATAEGTLVAIAGGRLEPESKLGDLVRAWRIVRASHPEARLWLVGDGPERSALYGLVGELDHRFRVLLPGHFDSLDELLQAADLAVFPAPCTYPPPLFNAALSCGLPVVAADGPALAETIERGIFPFPGGDVRGLAATLLALADRLTAQKEAADPGVKPCLPSPGDEAAAYISLINQCVPVPGDSSPVV